MSGSLFIRIDEGNRTVYRGEVDGAVELGRQDAGEDGPYSLVKNSSGDWRLVVARGEEATISRHHFRVQRLDDGKVRLHNLREVPIRLGEDVLLQPRTSCDLLLPFSLNFGKRTIFFQDQDEASSLLNLAEATMAPGSLANFTSRLRSRSLPSGFDTDEIFRWLKVTMEVLHSASYSQDFLGQAVQAAIDLVGLDTCRGLMLKNGEWQPDVIRLAPHISHDFEWQPSRQILDNLCREKKTYWQVPNPSASLWGIKAVVAAPILNRQGEVIGALYGDRRQDSRSLLPQISRLEAMLVELLASSVAAGLARLEQEQAALTARVQFEQFFTPELSRQLATQPDLLKGRQSDVSLLFADIRGFSRISGRLGPVRTVEWINDVMAMLSDCALAHHGVLVDYIGDEIIAMWGAPETQADHAMLACRTALDMLDALPALNERWHSQLGEPIVLGIGVNSGPAWVGNTGSRRKFKYGPLGSTVNLASRVEGATKFLKTSLLVTEATQKQLDASIPFRRLGKVRVFNIEEPVDLYEVVEPGRANWAVLKKGYEDALEQFEDRQLRGAARTLGQLVLEYPNDGPSLVLLSRVVNFLVDESQYEPVWHLADK
jgi:adenylate cyclase